MTRNTLLPAFALLIAAAAPVRAEDAKGPLVFAAASMKTALDAIVTQYTGSGIKPAPVVSYGSSGTLAKQIQNGAPADLFISADEKWMDVLAKGGLIDPASRHDLVGNALVLVEPADATATLKIAPNVDLAGAIGDGKLAVCTISSCPAGIYGKEALEKLGIFKAVEPKLAQADNVRAALLLVARGEAKFGIVYATDAKAEPKVKVVDTFPEDTHAPILYPVAVVKSGTGPGAEFEAYLRSPGATAILAAQGFTAVGK